MRCSGLRLGVFTVGMLAASGAYAGEPQKSAGAGDPSAKSAPAVRIGQPAPDFTLRDHTGKEHRLSEYSDKVVVLEWLNQECPYSLRAVPTVKALSTKYAEKGVVWLGVESTHWRKPEENVKYARDHELKYPILMDNEGKVGRLYGARTTPHIFVINKGTLAYAGALHDDPQGKKAANEIRHYVDEALAAVLGGKDVPLAETTPWGCSVKYKSGSPATEGKSGNSEAPQP